MINRKCPYYTEKIKNEYASIQTCAECGFCTFNVFQLLHSAIDVMNPYITIPRCKVIEECGYKKTPKELRKFKEEHNITTSTLQKIKSTLKDVQVLSFIETEEKINNCLLLAQQALDEIGELKCN